MKKVILLGSTSAGEKNDVRRMQDMLERRNGANIRFLTVYWENLLFTISNETQQVVDTVSGTDLAAADLLIAMNWYRGGNQAMYREATCTLALYLTAHNVAFWNEEMSKQRSASKLSTMMQLALLGCDIPSTSFALSSKILLKHGTISLPCVVKAARASRGRQNYRIEKKETLSRILTETGMPNPYLIQEYIPNDHDVRIICVHKEPSLGIKRQRTDKAAYLNNTSQGAQATLLDIAKLDAKIVQACRDICDAFGRNIAGIDLLPASSSNRHVFLEVNALPQLTSGTFAEQKAKALLGGIEKALERKEL